jgi:hypothetical protein
MSLRDAYFNGPSGIQQQMDGAFQAGIAYVGAGVADSSTLDLNDRNGSNLGAGSSNPGLYFTYASPTAIYAMWMFVSGEVAPTVANATLVQVTLLSGDSATQVAAKIAAAMNAIGGEPFSVVSSADVVTMTNNTAGGVVTPISAGTLGGNAEVNQVTPGVNPTGNYSVLQSALTAAAAQGLTDFMVVVQGTGTGNAQYLRYRNGRNQYLSSFFAGIQYALAGQNIYDYQCGLTLDISVSSSTNVIFSFHFGSHIKQERVNLEPLTSSCFNPNNTGFNSGVLPI